MKNERIYSAIGGADDEFLESLDGLGNKKKGIHWQRWGLVAACLALVVFVGVKYMQRGADLPYVMELPILTISEGSAGGMGFEGYYAYDISDLVNDNPWTADTQISTLPVFDNSLVLVEADRYDTPNADFDKMKEFLLEVANRLGMDTENLEITDDTPDMETQLMIIEKFASVGSGVPDGFFDPQNVILEDDEIKVQVDKQVSATIRFTPAIVLPSQYNYSDFATYDETYAVAEYLRVSYPDLINMVNPQINIYGGDYHVFSGEDIAYYGTDHANDYGIEFYDGNGNIIDQIINYNFNRVVFYDDDSKLSMARIFQPDLSEKVGDYPIITPEEATELLAAGNFITTVPYDFPGGLYVAKIELIYRKGGSEEYFMPYYRFYVELPEIVKRIPGLKTYGAYYVPAVEGKYISNMPLWDGRFN